MKNNDIDIDNNDDTILIILVITIIIGDDVAETQVDTIQKATRFELWVSGLLLFLGRVRTFFTWGEKPEGHRTGVWPCIAAQCR